MMKPHQGMAPCLGKPACPCFLKAKLRPKDTFESHTQSLMAHGSTA